MNFDFFASLFFPRPCVACGAAIAAGALCEPCFAKIAAVRGTNISHPVPACFLGAAGTYQNEVLKALIHALKFRGVQAAAGPLADALAAYAARLPEEYIASATVMPIPLSRERLRTRGFNQSERIARMVAERLGLPLDTRSLARTRNTKPQSETRSVAERRENVHGCFVVTDPRAVRGKRILLIDDVTTSGTTFLEATRALTGAGAAPVVALAVAQA
jgi:ComF family protein